MSRDIWAFIDESGNPNLDLDKDGASKFFIVTAVLVEATALDALRNELERIRSDHFQSGQMKSSTLGSNRKRWASVASSLAAVDFRFYALVVDKRAIDRTSGLQWKQSFYKNICGRAYGKLMQHLPSLHVRADRFGREDFKANFAKYIEEHHRPTLFERGTFDFVPSESDVAVQLADILCGLVARCFDPDREISNPQEILGVIAPKLLLLDEWSPRYHITSGESALYSSGDANSILSMHSLRSAETFLANARACD